MIPQLCEGSGFSPACGHGQSAHLKNVGGTGPQREASEISVGTQTVQEVEEDVTVNLPINYHTNSSRSLLGHHHADPSPMPTLEMSLSNDPQQWERSSLSLTPGVDRQALLHCAGGTRPQNIEDYPPANVNMVITEVNHCRQHSNDDGVCGSQAGASKNITASAVRVILSIIFL